VPLLALILWAMLPRIADSAPPAMQETLHYRIRIGVVSAGEATIVTRPVQRAGEPPSVEIRLTVRSSGLLSALYPIRDRITSRAAADDLRTLALDRRIREGRHREVDHWLVDHGRGLARERGGRQTTVPAGVHDVLSVLWKLRGTDLAAGDTLSLPVLLGHGVARMHVAVGEHREVEVPAGRFRCVPVWPGLDEPVDPSGEASMLIEFGVDRPRWPVRIGVQLPIVGRALVELVGVE
jgi:hypothetical protein